MSLATDLSDGIGGLKFVATAPVGVGRLVRIPFYLETATASFQAVAPVLLPVAQVSPHLLFLQLVNLLVLNLRLQLCVLHKSLGQL